MFVWPPASSLGWIHEIQTFRNKRSPKLCARLQALLRSVPSTEAIHICFVLAPWRIHLPQKETNKQTNSLAQGSDGHTQHLLSMPQLQFKYTSFQEKDLYFPYLFPLPGVEECRWTEMWIMTTLRLLASTSWLFHRPCALLLIGNRTYSQRHFQNS